MQLVFWIYGYSWSRGGMEGGGVWQLLIPHWGPLVKLSASITTPTLLAVRLVHQKTCMSFVCWLRARVCTVFFLKTLCNPVCCHDVEVWVHIRQKCLKVEFRHFDSNSSTWMCVCELSSPQVCFCAGMSASRGVWRQEAVSATAGVLCRSCLTHS